MSSEIFALDDSEWFRKIEEMREIGTEVLLEVMKEEKNRIKQLQRGQDRTEIERGTKWLYELMMEKCDAKERTRKSFPDSAQGPDKQGRQ